MNPNDIEDIYPLSPMQEGVLFHTLLDPGSGGLVNQLVFTIDGEVDVAAFKQAWREVARRHPVLRTGFLWKGRKKSLQFVRRSVSLPWTEMDWRSLPVAEQEARFEQLQNDERQQGFQLSKAPLLRLGLIRLNEKRYRFWWSFHHILLDGWSLRVVLRELLTCYHALRRGHSPSMPVAEPFRTFIDWRQKQDIEAAEQFWRRELAGFIEPTQFDASPDDGTTSRSAAQFEQRTVRLSSETSQSLHSFAQREHLTLPTIFQGLWAIVLSRYGQSNDVLFGTTNTGREPELAGVESIVGLLINTLPTRVRMRREMPLPDWLWALQDHQLKARQYGYAPLVSMQQWSDLPPGERLFDSIVVFEGEPDAALTDATLVGFKVSETRFHEQTNLPLNIFVVGDQSLTLRADFESTRFEPALIEGMIRLLVQLLEKTVRDGRQPLDELLCLVDEQHQRQFDTFNDTREPPGGPPTIHALFEAQAEQSPDRIAVVCGDCELTYGELNRRADDIAHVLCQRGVGNGDIVGIFLDRSEQLLVALLGVLKSGAAYLPLDPGYPAERLQVMTEDSQPAVVLTTSNLAAQAPVDKRWVLRLETLKPHPERTLDTDIDSCRDPANRRRAAYVMYTSGSTGGPKGVQVEHGSVVNLLEDMAERLEMTQDGALLSVTSISFDISALELFMPLSIGARVIIAAGDEVLDPARLSQQLEMSGATLMQATPSLWRMLVESGWKGDARLTVVSGGETLSRRLADDLLERSSVVWNVYGPTETTIWSTAEKVRPGTGPVSIGRPIRNTQVQLLDASGRPVPCMVPGELYLGGLGLARGYLNRPDLTSERFVPDSAGPHGTGLHSTGRLYRTGDLARLRSDGLLEFLGRKDRQIKIRGHRVEPGEIESAIEAHPFVSEAAVVLDDARSVSGRLIGYVAIESSQPLTADTLRAFLHRSLPDHMIPSVFAFLDTLPRTPNGKLDPNALSDGDASRPVLETDYVPCRNELERTLSGLWREVLDVDRVGVRDNFFDLGGHSLLIVAVHGKLQERFGEQSVKVIDLFQHPTIASLAEFLSEAGHGLTGQ